MGLLKSNEYDILGEKDKFRSLSTLLVKKTVLENKWFTFCRKVDDSVVDIARIKNDNGVTLGRMLLNELYGEEEELAIGFNVAINKFLVRNYLCYYEAPIVLKEKDLNGFRNSYNKYLITADMHVIALWLGKTYEEVEKEFGARVRGEDLYSNMMPYYKLYSKDGERKITKTRTDIDLSVKGTRVVPLYALKEGMDVLYDFLKKDTYNVTFEKDDGQKRVINTTFNLDKISSVYKTDYIAKSMENVYDGDFLNNPNLERGYIRIFEMGSSVYDSPLRSINYARIVKFEKAEPDLSYINIDLNTVLDAFKDYVKSNADVEKNISEFVDELDAFDVGNERNYGGVRLNSIYAIGQWADAEYVLLSTVFLRELALFMLGHPEWFGGYTGETYSKDYGMPEGLDDDWLDLG